MWNAWRRHLRRALTSVLGVGLGAVAWLAGTSVPAHSASNAGFAIHVHILAPPDPVTDLSASAVGIHDGDIQLVWTAPRNQNGVAIDHYFIRFATYPAGSPAAAQSWWNYAVPTEKKISATAAPGVVEFTTIGGLALGVTEYFAIKAVDAEAQISPIDLRAGLPSQAASLPVNTHSSPQTPANFAATALSSTTIYWSWDPSTGASFYMLDDYPSGKHIEQGPATNFSESGLTPNTALSRTVTAGNAAGVSSPTTAKTIYTVAALPVNLTASNVTHAQATLTWDSGGNPDGTQYRLERSNDDLNFVVVKLLTGLTFDDTGLREETDYYYHVIALNGDGVSTAPTASVKIRTKKKTDNLAPDEPLGFKGALDATGRAFTLIWEAVKQNADGTPLDDLAGYNVYRRTTLTGNGIKLNPTPLSTTAFADDVNGQTFYYTVRAMDIVGNESKESFIIDSSPAVNVIFVADDGKSSVVLSKDVNDLLRSAHNKYGVPLLMALTDKPVPANTNVVRTVHLSLLRGDTKEEIQDLAFAAPQAIIAIGYNLVNGQVAVGEPQLQSAAAEAGTSPDKLSMFWNNGVTWVKVGGTVDEADQSLKIKTSVLGDYQLRFSAAATSLSLDPASVFPRVFTPNGDGHNDRVYFVLQNPNNTAVTGEIYDLAGRHVASLKPPTANSGIGTTLTWDGKDSNGTVVPSGAYVYKVEGEGRTFTGTVAVAR